MTKLTKLYPYSRHLSMFLFAGSLLLLFTDIMPFALSFRLTFEYAALFYPTLVSLAFSMLAVWTYWRRELRHETLPSVAVCGFAAVFFLLYQTVFTIVALIMYNYDIVITGSGAFNVLGLFWITFRLYAVVQAAFCGLLIRWTYSLYRNPGVELEFLRGIKVDNTKQKKKMFVPQAPYAAGGYDYTEGLEKSREATV